MLQNLSEEIRECYRHAEECKRRAEGARDAATIADFSAMESRWLGMAHSYEFAERLSEFTEPFRKRQRREH